MSASKRFAYLFYRYYEKKCTQAEQDELFDLLQQSRHDETLKKLIAETWSFELPEYLQTPDTADRILEYITRQQPPITNSFARRTHASVSGRYFFFMKAAAVLLVVLSITFLAYYLSSRPSSARLAATPTLPKPVSDQCLTLSDGSKVLLHKDAHIHFPPVFLGKTREVFLTGEAYFDIRHDSRPFIVHTGKITTTVLGTAFDINAHEKDFIITVVKGKVRVEDETGEFSILKRNEQVTVDVIHNRLKKTMVDAGEVLSWKKPYLLFNDVSMKDAVAELQLRFRVGIRLTNPASESCHVTASFTRGESLEQIIMVLSKINNMEYKAAAGGGYELSGEGCK